MCDRPHYEDLDERVTELDKRLSLVENSVAEMREEMNIGFKDLKVTLTAFYEERKKWGEWARENLAVALKWVGWIILAACGITQASEILKLFHC